MPLSSPVAHTWLLGPFVALLAAASPAQEVQRTLAKTPQQTTDQEPPSGMRLDRPVTATHFVEVPLSDEPDFRRMEDILDKDGNVTKVRPVGDAYVLEFTGGSYTPQRGVDPDLRRTLIANPSGSTYGFVMIEGRMSQEKMEDLKRIGLTLYEVHTWQCIKAKIPAGSLAKLESLPFVRWVGYARLGQKIDVNYLPVLNAAHDEQRIPVVVNPFESDWNKNSKTILKGEHKVVETQALNAELAPTKVMIPHGRFQEQLEAMGFELKEWNPFTFSFIGTMPKQQILRVLKKDWVHTVEADLTLQLFNDQEVGMVGHDNVRRYYKGKGVPVGIIDSGLDSTPWHKDFLGKFFVGFNNAFTPLDDHGQHVGGTMFGAGKADTRYMGAIPEAGLGGRTDRIFYSRFGAGVSAHVVNMWSDHKDILNQTSPYPRVICNSWGANGAAGFNGTELNARTIDNSIYKRRQLWVFAAGNKLSTANMWCSSPGSAKNALTVGATIDSFNSQRTVQPGDRADFSRWGVVDRRTKPEVMAPGAWTTSCAINTTSGYINKSGTSMATPLVTGCLASKMQSDAWYKGNPEGLRARAVAAAKNDNTTSSGPWAAPQSGKGSRQTSGWGMFSSVDTVYQFRTSTFTYGGRFTRSGLTYESPAHTVPKDAQYVRIVLCITEPPASASAAQARNNDVRGYLDFAPYTSSRTTGDVSVASGYQTVMVFGRYTVIPSRRGKPFKMKVEGRSIRSGQANWCMIAYFYSSNPDATPVVSIISPTTSNPVKPGAYYTLRGAMRSIPGQGRFDNARMWYDGAFALNGFGRKTVDGVNQLYLSTNTHPSMNWPRVRKGAGYGMVVGSGNSRYLDFYLRAPTTNGSYRLTVGGTYDSQASPSPLRTAVRTVCVDGLTPNNISNLNSTSHVVGKWRNNRYVNLSWNTPTDRGCAGMEGLAYLLSTSNQIFVPSKVTATGAPKTTTIRAPADSSTGYYFYIKPRDKALNWGNAARVGPFKIDTVKPLAKSVVLNGGAAKTSNLKAVRVVVAGQDERSGLQSIRYYAGQWSSWMTYTSSRTIDLTAIGASITGGTKSVSVQVRDNAGNISNSNADTITYVPAPQISSVSGVLPNVTKSYYLLTGSGFTTADVVRFGSRQIVSKWNSTHENDWWAGRFRVLSDTQIRVYPPQDLPPGDYAVQVRNSNQVFGNSKTAKVTVWTASNNLMETQNVVSAGRTQYVLAAFGKNPAGTTQITMISTTQLPSSIPGLLTMGIGNNWTDYMLLPQLGFSSTTKTSAFSGPVPASAKGFSAYFQTAFMAPNTYPLPVSKVHKVTYK